MAAPTLTTIRTQIARLAAERATLIAAGPSRAERESGLRRFAEGAAAAGEERMRHAVLTDPTAALKVRSTPDGFVNLAALLTLLMGADRLADALIALLPPDDGTPNAEQRAERLAAIDARLLELGHKEEDLIEGFEYRGEPVQRRPEADPAVILRVRAAP